MRRVQAWFFSLWFVGLVGLNLSGSIVLAEEVSVGSTAPDFSLTDAQGKLRSLSEFSGKFVVLEWVNPDCPFVRKHYDSSNMQGLQQSHTDKDVVWLSINSSAQDKQGHLTQESAKAFLSERKANPTALLLDPDGRVGKQYGAKTTPHIFIINPQRILIYAGAIDDHPSTDPEDVKTARNYVRQVLDEAMAGKKVSITQTQAYGCSVKY